MGRIYASVVFSGVHVCHKCTLRLQPVKGFLKQVRDLIRLFRRAAKYQHQHFHQRPQDGLVQRYVHEQIPPEDYLLRNSQRRRQTYPQHSQASFGLSSISCARVMHLSSKSKARESEEPSRKMARKGRRKRRKVENERSKSPKADNCSSLNQPEEMGEADVAKNASLTREADDISNTNLSVVVREVNFTDSSKTLCQPKEILEAVDAILDNKGSDSSEPDHEIGNSKPGEFPGLQNDHDDCDGKQVSLVEESSNDGKCGLAGGRSEEQGKGLNVLKRALDIRGNVITKSSDSAPSSSGVIEGLTPSEVPELSLNLRSPSDGTVTVEGEDRILDKVAFSQVSDDVLDVEETGKIQNSAAGCEASAWDEEVKESLTEGSRHPLVEDSGGDYEENVWVRPAFIVETSVEESRYTISSVSDSDHAYDNGGQGLEGLKEHTETISSCRKEGDFGVPTAQLKEYAEISDKHEGNGEQNCKSTNLVKTSNECETETCHLNDVICDPVSVSPEVVEAEEMVDIGDDDIECEIPQCEEDAVNEMEVGDRDVPGVEDVEQVIEVGDNDGPNVEDVVQEVQVENDVFEGQGLQNLREEALEPVIHDAGIIVVDLNLPEAEAAVDEEDAIDDESSSEIPQMSESEGEGEDDEVLRSADGVSSENPDEMEVEDEEVECLENFPASEPHQLLEQEKDLVKAPEKDIQFQVSEAREDADVFNTAHDDRNSEQENLPHETRTVSHEGGPMNEFGRSVYDDTESESEDLQNTEAGTEQKFPCKEINLQNC